MQPFTPFYSPFGPGMMAAFIPLIIVVALWTVVIKGYALWHAARSGHKGWFVALLVINTLGILEVVYLIWFTPKDSNKLNSRGSQAPAHDSSPQA